MKIFITLLQRIPLYARLLDLVMLLTWLFLIYAQSICAQTQHKQQATSTSYTTSTEFDRVVELERKIDKLADHVNSELNTSNAQFQTVAQAMAYSTDRAFTVLFAFGAVGSLLGGIFVILSSYRDRKRYERERNFLEQRTLNIEKWQSDSHEREARFAEQQISLGANFLSKSDDMLLRQIESMTKLGGVIDLVKKTFEMQLKREEELEMIQKQQGKMEAILFNFEKHYQLQYSQAYDMILTFKNHSRMGWTRLSPQEESLAARARMIFETIPEHVYNQQKEKSPYELAHVYQLIGVSAFYANDIDAAARYLEKANAIYVANAPRPEDQYSRAFCSHFLGLIEKNWCLKGRSIEANMDEAKKHLEEANNLLAEKRGEFLTPLTLAEILSYIGGERGAAGKLLDDKIELLTGKLADNLDENQRALLGRAYILRGNLDFLNGEKDKALIWYKKSSEYYAVLSAAFVLTSDKSDEKKKMYQEGLKSLENSGATTKKENTVRVTALAWGVIASHEIGDKEKEIKFLKELDAIGSNIRRVGNREPLFFCPIQKSSVIFDQLRKNLVQLIKQT